MHLGKDGSVRFSITPVKASVSADKVLRLPFLP